MRNFVLSTRQLLGDIVCLRIWHDDSGGNDSAWFLNRICVTDLQTGKKYDFSFCLASDQQKRDVSITFSELAVAA